MKRYRNSWQNGPPLPTPEYEHGWHQAMHLAAVALARAKERDMNMGVSWIGLILAVVVTILSYYSVSAYQAKGQSACRLSRRVVFRDSQKGVVN